MREPVADAKLARTSAPLLDGSEADTSWPHMHLGRVNNAAARRALAEILAGRFCDEPGEGDDGGSDSNPSADERPADELQKIHKRLLNKLKRPIGGPADGRRLSPSWEGGFRVVGGSCAVVWTQRLGLECRLGALVSGVTPGRRGPQARAFGRARG